MIRQEHIERSKKIIIAFLIFYVGFQVGRWDAQHGYEAGLKFGKRVRSVFVKGEQQPRPTTEISGGERWMI